MKFSGLNTEQAAAADAESFPEVIDHPVGGPPPLPAGGQVLGYASTNAAELALPGGKSAVVESMQPMAVETSPGDRLPVDLSLSEVGGGYESVRPVVGVVVPRRSSGGVQLPEAGLSLTAVDVQGSPLGGAEGVDEGGSVVYANTQTDTDTIVKPTTAGFDADTVLRSVDSPGQLYFRVGLPEGASLVQAQGMGQVSVLEGGQRIAVVRAPSAVDAAGTLVPVSMSVEGDLLVLSVSVSPEDDEWPIMVDPEVIKETEIGQSACHKEGEAERASGNWCIYTDNPSRFTDEWAGSIDLWTTGSIGTGEYESAIYTTQGDSKIYEVEAYTRNIMGLRGRARLQVTRNITHSGGPEEGEVEREFILATHENVAGVSKLCAEAKLECPTSAGHENNSAVYRIEATEPAGGGIGEGIEGDLGEVYVFIAQETAPEISFNTASPEIDEVEGKKRVNVLYGSGSWLSPTAGAVEVTAHDKGIGVSFAEMIMPKFFHLPERIYEEHKCNGVQCNENYSMTVTYNPQMENGVDSMEMIAKNLAGSGGVGELGLEGEGTHLVKVDGEPPYGLSVSGWSARREITATPHTLTFEATDGTAPTLSSGVKSIGVQVDGGLVSLVPNLTCGGGGCKGGPDTAKGTWTLDAEDLSEGVHRLTVTASDNAGNVAAKEFTFDVRHGAPVSVGPGTVDPTTGQFKLGATDVSLAGSGGVSRVYESRDLTAGAAGPLGPQWALSLGGGQGLTVLPSGSVVLSSSSGGVTTFTRNEKGEFESPLGDGDVKVEAKEKEAGKGITAYLLKNTTAGTTTTFEQPKGSEETAPVYASQFGTEGAQLSHPEGVAIDFHGDVWVVDRLNGRILKFSSAGVLLAAYGGYGTAAGNLTAPRSIAINQSTGNVYVTDEGNSRVVELNSSGEFLRTFGWDVKPAGREEPEVCSEYCKPGLAGPGAGQFKEPKGIAIDSSGNVWVVDAGNNRVEEFNEVGGYEKTFGSAGSGEGQFKAATEVAFYGGDLYVVEAGNDRVQELSTEGKYIAQLGTGKEGTGSGEFKNPTGVAVEPNTGNVYVADSGNDRVQEFNSARKLIAKFGSVGSGNGQFSEPSGVAAGSAGVYVADLNNGRVQEWMRPSWLPTRSEGPLTSTTTSYAYKAVEEEGQTVIEPVEAVAPAPAGVTCIKAEEKTVGEELKKGCRALLFVYAAKTKSGIGEKPSEWGEYTGHLASVSFKAYNPAKGAEKMEEKAVAEYAYDSKGRLRAEWDPRISPNLKTTYGYDSEGHVTALTSSGQQPWAFTYGTIAGDGSTGRLLKVAQAQPKAGASEEAIKERLSEQKEEPKNGGAPTLLGAPVVGVQMTVSNGSWSNAPVAYAYQWEDCNTEGKECAPILGATNANYTVMSTDVGHTLVAQVMATNGWGSEASTTAHSVVVVTENPPTYTGQIDSTGKEDGMLNHPGGVAVDAKGDVWVADYNTDRVEELKESGEFVQGFGSKGSGAGQLNAPMALAVDSHGNVWVADSKNDRIDEFSEQGVFVEAFGFGVSNGEDKFEVCTTSCQAGIGGSGNGQFEQPEGVAVDSHGDVWVSDTFNGRLEEFNEKGEFVKAVASKGSEPGQLGLPVGLTIDSRGNVWVADWRYRRVVEFNEKGEYVRQFGTPGSGHGQLWYPSDVAVAANGDVYVLDEGNERIEEFGEEGEYMSAFGSEGAGNGQFIFTSPDGLALDSHGDLWVTDSDNDRIEKFVVPVTENPPTYTGQIDSTGKEDGMLNHPGGVAVDAKGDVWVADYNTDRVEELKESGEFVQGFGSKGSGAGQLNAPMALAVDSHGNVWVADSKNDRIDEFSEKGVFVEAFGFGVSNGEDKFEVCTTSCQAGIGGSGNGQFEQPEGVAVDSHGDVWVSDTFNGRLEEFNEKSEFVKAVASKGSEPGQLGLPVGLTIDSRGNVWVADWRYRRVVEFSEKGEYVRQFGTPGSGNGQLWYPSDVAVTTNGDVYVLDEGNERIEEFSEVGEYLSAFGDEGGGNSQFIFTSPDGLALDPSGDLWVSDSDNDRIEKFAVPSINEGEHQSPQPGFTIEYHIPLSGSGLPTMTESEVAKWGQKDDPTEGMAVFPLDEPQSWPASKYTCATIHYYDAEGRTVNTVVPGGGIATSEYNETNDVVRTLSADNRATALNETGKTVEASEKLDTKSTYNAEGTKLESTLGPEHTVKIAKGNEKVKSGSEVLARDHIKYYYDEGSPEGKTYDLVTKTVDAARTAGGEEFDPRETTTSYSGQNNLGWTLRKPTSITKEPNGLDLTTSTIYEPSTGNVTETRSPQGEPAMYAGQIDSTGKEEGMLNRPGGVTIDSKGDLWVADYNTNRIEELNEKGSFLQGFGTKGSGAGQLNSPMALAVDSRGNVWVADAKNNRVDEFSEKGVFVEAFGFGVSNGEDKFEVCTTSCQAGIGGSGNGQFEQPEGVAVDSHGDMWVSDTFNGRLEEFNEKGEFVRAVASKGSEPGQLGLPVGLTIDSRGNVWVADWRYRRVVEFNEKGEYVRQFGTPGSGHGQLWYPSDVAVAANGDVYVLDEGNERIEEFNEEGEYMSAFGSEGTGNGQFIFTSPDGLALDSHGDLWVTDSDNDRIEKFTIPDTIGDPSAHDARTTYYSSGEESTVAECRKHPEWANLPCQIEPAAQTGVSGSPEQPVTTFTYNMWDEVEKTEEKFGTGSGAVTRTKNQTYDAAGRALTSDETAQNEKKEPIDATLPEVTNKYNTETGALEKQSATIVGKTKTITSKDNTLGQLESYTDAEGETSKYIYGGPADDDQVQEMSYEIGKEKFSQTYAYSPTKMMLEKLADSVAGTFTATYDVEGKMLTEGYPNGMTASYTYNSVGATTGIEYVKNTDCASKCPETWFSDTDVPSIHGETLTQMSTLSKENYVYDNDGRLTETQETPAGKDCKSRLYSYDEESNRISQTTRESSTETCPTEGGTTQTHTYDSANHLIDTGVKYETLGNTVTLPEADAEGHALTSTYYVDNQVASQTQNEETDEYLYDPVGRPMETKATGKTTATMISHYTGPGDALTWTCEEGKKECEEGTETKWSRNIPGIDGALDAIQSSSGSTTLQLHDLQGDIIATAGDKESETKLLSTYNSTEFGVPNEGKAPPKYAWLGAGGLASETSFGTGTVTQGGASYVPQVARNLQTAPVVPPGAFPDGSGTGSQYDSVIPGWSVALANQESANTIAEYTAEQAALKKQAEEEAAATAQRIHEEEEIPNPNEGGAEGEEEGTDPEFGDNTHGCRVWASWGDLSEGATNDEVGYGHFECTYASAGFELAVELQLVISGGVEGGVYRLVGKGHKDFSKKESKGEHSENWEFTCEPGKWYRLIAWGHYWYSGGYSPWHAYSVDGRGQQCSPEPAAWEPE